MKALILDGTKGDGFSASVRGRTEEILTGAGWQTETLTLRDMRIGYCKGCFGCWIKTPGICAINDEGRTVMERAVKSDLLVFVTPVTFGGYSAMLKRAMDRLLPLLLPFLIKVKGRTRHPLRYEKLPSLLAIGILPGPDAEKEKIFEELLDANAANLRKLNSCILLKSVDAEIELKIKVSEFLNRLEHGR